MRELAARHKISDFFMINVCSDFQNVCVRGPRGALGRASDS